MTTVTLKKNTVLVKGVKPGRQVERLTYEIGLRGYDGPVFGALALAREMNERGVKPDGYVFTVMDLGGRIIQTTEVETKTTYQTKAVER